MKSTLFIADALQSDAISLVSLIQHPLVEAVGWALIHSLWIVALMTLILYALLRVTRKASSQTRYMISCITLFSMPLVLIVAIGIGLSTQPNPSYRTVGSANPENNFPAVTVVPSDTAFNADLAFSASPKQIPSQVATKESGGAEVAMTEWGMQVVRSRLPWIVALWLAGVAIFSLRPLTGWLAVERLRRSGVENVSDAAKNILERTATKLNLNRTVKLVESTLVATPIVVGWLRPMILLPVSAMTGLSEKDLAALLAHELAHVRRHDYLVNLLQTVVETMMYYHPCVWWVSRVIREERENCCDDMAIRVCDQSDYAQALLAMEQMRDQQPALAMSAKGGSLVKRIRRIAGLPGADSADGPHGWAGSITLLATIAVAMMFVLLTVSNLNAAEDENGAWGTVADGLRMRAVPVLASMSEDKILLDEQNEIYQKYGDVAFAIEVENVTDKPIKFLDTRYGPQFGDSAGKANSDWLSQFLFSIKYFDKDGKLIAQPAVQILDLGLPLGSANLSEIKPKAKHTFLVRPAKMLGLMQPRLEKGNYSATISYLGMSRKAAARLKKRKPDSPILSAWSGSVSTPNVKFELDFDESAKRPNPVWGKPVDGIQTAVEVETGQQVCRSKDKLKLSLLVKNTNPKPVVLSGFTWLTDDMVDVVDSIGAAVKVEHTFYSGWTISGRVTLNPGQVCKFDAGNIGIAKDIVTAKKFKDVTHRKLIAPPGKYKFRIKHFFSPSELKDGKGNLISPNEDDWSGTVTSGWLPIEIAEPREHSGQLRLDSDTNEFQITGIANHDGRNEKNVEVTVTFYKVDSKINEPIVWTKLQKFSTDDSGFYVIKIPEKLGRDPAFRLGVKL